MTLGVVLKFWLVLGLIAAAISTTEGETVLAFLEELPEAETLVSIVIFSLHREIFISQVNMDFKVLNLDLIVLR